MRAKVILVAIALWMKELRTSPLMLRGRSEKYESIMPSRGWSSGSLFVVSLIYLLLPSPPYSHRFAFICVAFICVPRAPLPCLSANLHTPISHIPLEDH